MGSTPIAGTMKLARLFLKSISWRLVASVITATVAFFLTGSFTLAAGIAGIDGMIKIFAYMGHEWIWEKRSPYSSTGKSSRLLSDG